VGSLIFRPNWAKAALKLSLWSGGDRQFLKWNALCRWSIVFDASHCLVYYGKIWNALQHQLMRVGGVEQEKSGALKPQKIKALNIYLGTNFSTDQVQLT
jgi:hypothetical protein